MKKINVNQDNEPKKITRSYILPRDLVRAVAICAADREKDKSEIVQYALIEYLPKKYFE